MSDSVQLIKEKLDIVEVISSYVELHKAGTNYKGKSPFTSEKTPSFYVSPDRGLYYCFSSNQGGDMFNFVQVMEGVDFKGALQLLANKAGVELVREDPQKRTERDQLHTALSEAVGFYAQKLASTPEALQYLIDRGMEVETSKRWQIGYAPGPPLGGWRELKEHLHALGFSDTTQLKAGLIKPGPDGKESYDLFRDRLVFPMNDPVGKTVAFSGRILHPNDNAPKYVNSPETELYKKSQLLYGYDKAKQGIRKLDFSLIVEGQFDVVLAHQAGYTNTVAVSGTALTPEHVRLLERLSNRVVLALDADRAGIAAVKKSATIMLARGLDVKVAALPEGEDPADLIKTGKERFKKVIGEAVHVVEFLLVVVKRRAKDERHYKLLVREEVLPLIAVIENKIDQEHFEQLVAERLETSHTAVHFEVERIMQEPTTGGAHGEIDESKVLPSAVWRRLESVKIAAVALIDIMPLPHRDIYQQVLSEILGQPATVDGLGIDTKELSRQSFQLEDQYSGEERLKHLLSYAIATLNELKLGLARAQLKIYRGELAIAEAQKDLQTSAELLEKVQTAQARVAAEPYDDSLFIPRKD